MLTLDTKVVMDKGALPTVNKVEKTCQYHFSDFMEETLKSASNRQLSGIVINHKLALFSTHHAPDVKKQ